MCQIKSPNSLEIYFQQFQDNPQLSGQTLTWDIENFFTYKLMSPNMHIASSFVPPVMTFIRKEPHKQLENAQNTL